MIKSTDGSHQSGKNSSDIFGFNASSKNIQYFPKGLELIFGNLKGIYIYEGRLKEIHQSDLKPFPKLVNLKLLKNDIEILDDGLFKFNPDLQFIDLEENKIFHMGIDVFENLDKLFRLWLAGNICISRTVGSKSESRTLVGETKTKCQNSEYLIIENGLKQLENTTVCTHSMTPSIYQQKVQDLEKKFTRSKVSRSLFLKERIEELSNSKYTQLHHINAKVCIVEKSLNDSKTEILEVVGRIENDVKKSQEISKQSQRDQEGKFSNLSKSINDLSITTSTKSDKLENGFKWLVLQISKISQKLIVLEKAQKEVTP